MKNKIQDLINNYRSSIKSLETRLLELEGEWTKTHPEKRDPNQKVHIATFQDVLSERRRFLNELEGISK